MVKSTSFPCETAVWNLLPRIRADMSRILAEKGIKHKEISIILGVTPAAISQYIHKKRGRNDDAKSDYIRQVNTACERIISGEDVNISEIICAICQSCRD